MIVHLTAIWPRESLLYVWRWLLVAVVFAGCRDQGQVSVDPLKLPEPELQQLEPDVTNKAEMQFPERLLAAGHSFQVRFVYRARQKASGYPDLALHVVGSARMTGQDADTPTISDLKMESLPKASTLNAQLRDKPGFMWRWLSTGWPRGVVAVGQCWKNKGWRWCYEGRTNKGGLVRGRSSMGTGWVEVDSSGIRRAYSRKKEPAQSKGQGVVQVTRLELLLSRKK